MFPPALFGQSLLPKGHHCSDGVYSRWEPLTHGITLYVLFGIFASGFAAVSYPLLPLCPGEIRVASRTLFSYSQRFLWDSCARAEASPISTVSPYTSVLPDSGNRSWGPGAPGSSSSERLNGSGSGPTCHLSVPPPCKGTLQLCLLPGAIVR